MEEQDLKALVQKNQEVLDSLDKRLHKIEKRFRTAAILNAIKWVIIVVPIIFGIIYISPYVKNYVRMIEPALRVLNLDSINEMFNANEVNVQAPTVNGLESLCDPVKRQAIINQVCK